MTAAGPDPEPDRPGSPLARLWRRDRARTGDAPTTAPAPGDDAAVRTAAQPPSGSAEAEGTVVGRDEGPAVPTQPTGPLTSEEAVEAALPRWRVALVEHVGGSSLEDITVLGDAVLDLSSAHPSGLAQLLAGRPTRLSNLFREPDALPTARRHARAVVAQTQDYAQRYGTAPTYLAIGVASWSGTAGPGPGPRSDDMAALAKVATSSFRAVHPALAASSSPLALEASARTSEDGNATGTRGADGAEAAKDVKGSAAPPEGDTTAVRAAEPSPSASGPSAPDPTGDGPPPRRVNAPVLLRSLTISTAGRSGTDFELTLEPTVELNTLLVRALRDHGALIDPVSLAQGAFTGVGFDPSAVLARIGTLGAAVLEDFSLTDRRLVGSFVHPGQHLVDDLDELAPGLARHEVVAALAGSSQVTVPVGTPLPPERAADGDPVLERGVGDLDQAQRRAVDALVAGGHFAIDAPSGSDVVGTVAALLAEAAASGRQALYVTGHRRAADAVSSRLGDLGLGELTFEIAAEPGWRASAANRLLTAMASEPAQTDLSVHAETMDALVGARARLTAYIEALHLPRAPWGVSAYDALQALARLMSERPAPETAVRLSSEVTSALDDDTRAGAAADLERAADLGAFTLHAATTPWFDADLETEDDARSTLLRLDRLRTQTLPRLREQIEYVSRETDLTAATTLGEWQAVLQMLGGMRGTLDVFQPLVFEQPAVDMVQATATKQWRLDHGIEMGGVARRRLVRRAKDMLRPGIRVSDLHAALLQVEAQRAVWATHCPTGSWPRLPEGLSAIEDTNEAVRIDVEELSRVLAPTPGGGALLDLSFDDLGARLDALAEDRSALDDLPERTAAVRRARAAGLSELVDDLSRRAVAPGLVGTELELAWWSSVFEQIVATDPALTGQDGPGLDALAARFRDLDRRHVTALPVSVLNHVHARTVEAMRVDPEATKALFSELIEGRLRTVRDLHERHTELVRALRPVVVATPTLVPQLFPTTRTVDLVVLDAVQHVPLEMLLAAIARGRQIVVVGDVRSASTPAVRELARVLPTLTLRSDATRRDPHLVGFLTKHGYDGVLAPAPLPASRATVHLHVTDGLGMPDPVSGAVESTQAELDRVVELAIEHAMTRPEQTLGVVAVTPAHAARIREALLAEVRRNPGLAGFFAGSRPEPVVVADLTGVAGLTRDAIILTLGFGKTPHGRVLHRFGLVGEAGGDALLLDAVGASRERLDVVSCFRADELDPDRLRGAGARLLADLLAFAEERDGKADALELWNGVDVARGTDRLVLDLAERLWRTGLVVETDFGPAGADRVPLVVGHPDVPGELLVAVLTDDEAYVAQPSVRVRERQRRERLERLGWTVVQVWSAAAFLDPEKEAERIRRAALAVRDARLGVGRQSVVTGATSLPRTASAARRRVEPSAPEPVLPVVPVAPVAQAGEPTGSGEPASSGGTTPSGESGTDADVNTTPEAPTEGTPDDGSTGRRGARRRVVRPGTERESVLGSTSDDVDADGAERGGDANDERLRRDVPPHWQ
ncbi:hypothetical protein GCM10025864_25230 [Luteimicrobium album]|uniref:Restriction endonuclease type II-like domain-containing protein n=1 Tax=Luteimicrobium album TaxID=1054550 RepID=A0ABQ6I456_9MICO|nr:hypothetical protein [Luteimicrobium album]GMA24764.1 hypothetical protein GCM10025864_25230 [Luteimicrobium album]